MSAWLPRAAPRTAALAVLVGIAFAAWGCMTDRAEQVPLDQEPVQVPPPAAGAPDSTLAQEPALEPGAGVPDQGAAASVQTAEDRPRVLRPSVVLEARRDSFPRARVVQGLVELQLQDGQLTPADYLRVSLRRRSGGMHQAVTSSTGEFFFQDLARDVYLLEVRTLDKESRVVHSTDVAIDSGQVVRLAPIRVPIGLVKARR